METSERLENELALLEAMYPAQITWDNHSRELKYSSSDRSFQLRLLDGYLVSELPQVLSATLGRADVGQQLQQQIRICDVGSEILDFLVLAFNELSTSNAASEDKEPLSTDRHVEVDAENPPKATIIVWLHHLLNTNKRKQALSPASSDVSGVTKPGYPGVLIYSGPSDAVYEHVNGLKQLNWQAFQVRLESEEEWIFTHAEGVKEVEAMKDVVAEVGASRKEDFMQAMRMR